MSPYPLLAVLLASPIVLAFAAQAAGQEPVVPVIRIDRPNMRIDSSCIIASGHYRVADEDGTGVIEIAADGIFIIFEEGAILDGSRPEQEPNEFSGIGIMLNGHRNVSIAGAMIRGFKVGIFAEDADGLTVEGCDLSGNFRQRLGSTPQREDSSDWLWPHRNDNDEWITNWGAALYVKNSRDVTIRRNRVREGQNGILLSRVTDSRLYDNDASFLSGWGLGLWRSSRNVITRNAFDFCVRGYSHMVYNRGQDSAGILMFEQCHENLIAENSATHGGDGFFGFAGRETLGEEPPKHSSEHGLPGRMHDREQGPPDAHGVEAHAPRTHDREQGQPDARGLEAHAPRTHDREQGPPDAHGLEAHAPQWSEEELIEFTRRRGNNDNLLINNDFSYAPAHGIEMTFSFGNRFIGNRLVENAICGVWGGFSQETIIALNHFEGNGEMPYGNERGGINIEHGRANRIEWNTFRNNRCGVFFFRRDHARLLEQPWAKANHRGSVDNSVTSNTFEGDLIALQVRDSREIVFVENQLTDVPTEIDADEKSEVLTDVLIPAVVFTAPEYKALGETRPVGARRHLSGRRNIIMTEWGPWDHETPTMRLYARTHEGHEYDLLGVGEIETLPDFGPGVSARIEEIAENWRRLILRAERPGVVGYRGVMKADDFEREITGTIIAAAWEVTFFNWDRETDPRENLDAWRALARGESAVTVTVDSLNLPFGTGGPGNLGIAELRGAGLGRDYFGTIARASIPLTAGRWRIRTLSDDGVRVTINPERGLPGREDGLEAHAPAPVRVIDNWTWHAPTVDIGEFTLEEDRTVEFLVEHFEIDGYAVLEFSIERVE